jgi:lysine biosynthesis protein LysW
MAVSYCLDCGGRIYLGQRPWVGQAAFCRRCGADLEVTHVNPLTLDWTDNLVDEEWNKEPALRPEMIDVAPV